MVFDELCDSTFQETDILKVQYTDESSFQMFAIWIPTMSPFLQRRPCVDNEYMEAYSGTFFQHDHFFFQYVMNLSHP